MSETLAGIFVCCLLAVLVILVTMSDTKVLRAYEMTKREMAYPLDADSPIERLVKESRQKDARIAELEKQLKLHDAYREVAEAAAAYQPGNLDSEKAWDAAMNRHGPAIRAAMGEDDE
jgi:hypothetical protein